MITPDFSSAPPSEPDPNDPTQFMPEMPTGTLIYGYAMDEEGPYIEILIRETSANIARYKSAPDLQIRAGIILKNDIPVVVVLFSFNPDIAIYPSFWNFHHSAQSQEDGHLFDHLAHSTRELAFKIFGDSGNVEFLFPVKHPLSSFFETLSASLPQFDAWSENDFQFAVHQIYQDHPTPESLWEHILKSDQPASTNPFDSLPPHP